MSGDDGYRPRVPQTQLVVDQTFDGRSLYRVRATVAAHAAACGLSPRRSGDLVLAVHELAANAVQHGGGGGRLRIIKQRGELLCEVTDEGQGGPAAIAGAASHLAVAWRIERGHGLWLVRQLAEQTSVRTGPAGSAVTVSMGLDPASPLPPSHLFMVGGG